MKYYIIAGEASGDLHGSNLIKAIHKNDATANIRCWGGKLMQAANATLVKDYKDLAFMGFVEVIKNLPTIFKNLAFCKQDITAFSPDVVILIDYPGFNLRIAEWAKKKGYKVVYYIAPQVWAWKENRVKKMKTCIDKMLVILPFEKKFFEDKWHWPVTYVGHPLVEVVEAALQQPTTPLSNKPIIALLPGSRKQEILKKLPIMLACSHHFPTYQFIVAQAPGLESSFYNTLLAPYSNVSVVNNSTYSLLQQSKAALVTSGTATLETALIGVPEIVCYKGSNISVAIARLLVKIKYISLVNLIMDKLVVEELIQEQLTVENLVLGLKNLLYNTAHQQQIARDYNNLFSLLKKGGKASENASNEIQRFLSKP